VAHHHDVPRLHPAKGVDVRDEKPLHAQAKQSYCRQQCYGSRSGRTRILLAGS
jgi:hypothetical protein